MKIAISLALVGVTAAAAAVAAVSPQANAPAPAPAAKRCIFLDQVVGRRTVGPNSVEFDVVGGITYRNELATACKSIERLGPSAIIGVTSDGDTGMLCAGDRVKIFDPVEIKATGLRSYPYCRLGNFTVASAPANAKQ
jgi:hypothetical protein